MNKEKTVEMNWLSRDEQVRAVKENPYLIANIINPDVAVQRAAYEKIMKDAGGHAVSIPGNINVMKVTYHQILDKDPAGAERFRKLYGAEIERAYESPAKESPVKEGGKEAPSRAPEDRNPYSGIEKMDYGKQLEAVKKDWRAIEGITAPDIELQSAAYKGFYEEVQRTGGKGIRVPRNINVNRVLLHVSEDMEPARRELVREKIMEKDGLMLRHVKDPSYRTVMAALRQNGEAIRFVNAPSEEMVMTALRSNGFAIRHVKNPTEKMVDTALSQNGYAINCIKDPDVRQQDIALRQLESSESRVSVPRCINVDKVYQLRSALSGRAGRPSAPMHRSSRAELMDSLSRRRPGGERNVPAHGKNRGFDR